jgi:hypothetical protein
VEFFDSFGIPDFAKVENKGDIITLTVIGLLLLISLLSYGQIIARKNIHAQKKIDTMYLFLFFTVPMALFVNVLSIQYLLTLSVPMALFVAILIRTVRHPAIAESLHFIFFVTSIVTHFLFLM